MGYFLKSVKKPKLLATIFLWCLAFPPAIPSLFSQGEITAGCG